MGRRFVGRRLVPEHVIQQRMNDQDDRRAEELRQRIAAFRRRTQGPFPWSPVVDVDAPALVVKVIVAPEPIVVDISQPTSGGDQ